MRRNISGTWQHKDKRAPRAAARLLPLGVIIDYRVLGRRVKLLVWSKHTKSAAFHRTLLLAFFWAGISTLGPARVCASRGEDVQSYAK